MYSLIILIVGSLISFPLYVMVNNIYLISDNIDSTWQKVPLRESAEEISHLSPQGSFKVHRHKMSSFQGCATIVGATLHGFHQTMMVRVPNKLPRFTLPSDKSDPLYAALYGVILYNAEWTKVYNIKSVFKKETPRLRWGIQ